MILHFDVFCSSLEKKRFSTAMKLWLSLKTLQKTSGFGRWISKINYMTENLHQVKYVWVTYAL